VCAFQSKIGLLNDSLMALKSWQPTSSRAAERALYRFSTVIYSKHLSRVNCFT